MKDQTTFILLVGAFLASTVLLSFGYPEAAMGESVGAAINRFAIVFASMNAVLLTACLKGYFSDREWFHDRMKHPRLVLAILVADAMALGIIFGGLLHGPVLLIENAMIAKLWMATVGYAIFNTLALLILYKDALSPTSTLRVAEAEEAGPA